MNKIVSGTVVTLKSRIGQWTVDETNPENRDDLIGVESDYEHIFTLKSDIDQVLYE